MSLFRNAQEEEEEEEKVEGKNMFNTTFDELLKRKSYTNEDLEGMSEEKKARIAKAKEIFPTLAGKAYCINLKERPDRKEAVTKNFEAVGLGGGYVEFFLADRHPGGTKWGCYDSHRAIIQKAYDEGLEMGMFFEDDVCFYDGWDEVVLDLKEFIDAKQVAFNVIFMGCGTQWIGKKTTPKIWLVKAQQNHAYILSRAGMKLYLDSHDFFTDRITNRGKCQDVWLCYCMPRMYAHCNFLSIQQDITMEANNDWFPNLPVIYSEWLKRDVSIRTFLRYASIMSSDSFVHSYFNQHYKIVGSIEGVMDDGEVRLKAVPGIELVVYIYFLVTTWPYPRGVWGVVTDIVIPFWKKILTRSKLTLREMYEQKEAKKKQM